MSNWIQTYTGRTVDLLTPKVDQISILDIAHSLSQKCRYSGHTIEFYSVAYHSIIVSMAVLAQHRDIELAYKALFHDAAESYLGDLPGPLKPYLPDYKKIEDNFESVVADYIGVDTLKDPRIKEADMRILMDERYHLLFPANRRWTLDLEPLLSPEASDEVLGSPLPSMEVVRESFILLAKYYLQNMESGINSRRDKLLEEVECLLNANLENTTNFYLQLNFLA